MRIYRLTSPRDSARITMLGGVERGSVFVGDDGLVRWFSSEDQSRFTHVAAAGGYAYGSIFELPDEQNPALRADTAARSAVG